MLYPFLGGIVITLLVSGAGAVWFLWRSGFWDNENNPPR